MIRAFSGLQVILASLWGGAYFAHIYAAGWQLFPILISSVMFCLFGFAVFVRGIESVIE